MKKWESTRGKKNIKKTKSPDPVSSDMTSRTHYISVINVERLLVDVSLQRTRGRKKY